MTKLHIWYTLKIKLYPCSSGYLIDVPWLYELLFYYIVFALNKVRNTIYTFKAWIIFIFHNSVVNHYPVEEKKNRLRISTFLYKIFVARLINFHKCFIISILNLQRWKKLKLVLWIFRHKMFSNITLKELILNKLQPWIYTWINFYVSFKISWSM